VIKISLLFPPARHNKVCEHGGRALCRIVHLINLDNSTTRTFSKILILSNTPFRNPHSAKYTFPVQTDNRMCISPGWIDIRICISSGWTDNSTYPAEHLHVEFSWVVVIITGLTSFKCCNRTCYSARQEQVLSNANDVGEMTFLLPGAKVPPNFRSFAPSPEANATVCKKFHDLFSVYTNV